MALSTEDEFRLNVLLASDPQAIRIDESRMQLVVLGHDNKDRLLQLNPTGRDEIYLRTVRHMLAEKYGFPGGYPAQLNRWSEMGQSSASNLFRLLLLGEPEAVIAVSATCNISHELAALAWWALPTADNARHLLAHHSVINGECGSEVADYLIEYLPFETQTCSITQSVNRLLTAGLAAPRHVDQWWTRAQRSGAYMLGFLQAIPDDLPDTHRNTHPLLDSHRASLSMLGNASSPVAQQLLQIFSATGQAYIRAARLALCKSEDQETMIATLENIACYFKPCRIDGASVGVWEEILLSVDETPRKMTDAERQVIEQSGELHSLVRAMSILSLVSYEIVRPVLSNTTASGSLMRRKLTPVVSQLDNQLAVLLG